MHSTGRKMGPQLFRYHTTSGAAIARARFAFALITLIFLASCAGAPPNLKKIFTPPDVVVDTTAPHYFHNVSEVKYWDRINAANRATNFAWTDSVGKVHEMYEYYDKVVVLFFFGTWSPPALAQLATIDSVRALGDTNVAYIGVTMREGAIGGKTVMRIDSFARAHAIPYQIVLGSRDFGFTYGGIDVVPTTFVITVKHKIAGTFEGYATKGQLLDAIEKAEKNP